MLSLQTPADLPSVAVYRFLIFCASFNGQSIVVFRRTAFQTSQRLPFKNKDADNLKLLWIIDIVISTDSTSAMAGPGCPGRLVLMTGRSFQKSLSYDILQSLKAVYRQKWALQRDWATHIANSVLWSQIRTNTTNFESWSSKQVCVAYTVPGRQVRSIVTYILCY